MYVWPVEQCDVEYTKASRGIISDGCAFLFIVYAGNSMHIHKFYITR